MSSVANSTTYTLDVINEQASYTSASSGATASSILKGLRDDINGSISHNVTASQFTDIDGTERLKIEADSNHDDFVVLNPSSNLSLDGQDVYVALYTDDPTDADTGTEVSAGGYNREKASWNSPSSGSTSNSADITFGPATAD